MFRTTLKVMQEKENLSRRSKYYIMTMPYFVSDQHLKKLNPRIPCNFLTKNGYEENETKRVCCSLSIEGCLIGLSKNLKGKILNVYEVLDDDFITPSIKQVPDSFITYEIWYLHDVKLNFIGKIKIKDVSNSYKYKYGNKIAETYSWNYGWIK
jgi:hypothetical protein